MKKKLSSPKIKPWPGCTFELEIKWKKGAFSDRHLWVHLARRVSGKFGRLEVMHAIVLGKRADPQARYMFGAKYHKNLYTSALDIIKQAGVPEKLREEYFKRMNRELPLPTEEKLFLHSLESPFLIKILGKRKDELSYFRTGRADLTPEDRKLIMKCLNQKIESVRHEPNGAEAVAKLIQGIF